MHEGDAAFLADGQAEEAMLRGPRWELHIHHRKRTRHLWKGQDRKSGSRAKQHHKLDLGDIQDHLDSDIWGWQDRRQEFMFTSESAAGDVA